MRIVTFFCYGEQPWAKLMLASVRKFMPDWHIIQFSDVDTHLIEGADERRTLDLLTPRVKTRFACLASLSPTDRVICLDTDVLLKSDIGFIFERSPFDVALTYRDHDVWDPNGINVARVMPYNTGVMFSRSSTFWRECLDQYPDTDAWYADQLAVKSVADSGRYKVMRLPATKFNFTPASEDATDDAFVYHYKGPDKKVWMQRAAH